MALVLLYCVIYAECHYAECHKRPFMVSVVMLNVVTPDRQPQLFNYEGFI
jgi:hypothetical protein